MIDGPTPWQLGLIAGLLVIGGLTIALWRHHARVLQTQARLLQALSDIGRLTLRHPDPTMLLEQARRILIDIGGFDAVSVFVTGRDGHERRLCMINPADGGQVPGLPETLDLDTAEESTRELAAALGHGIPRVLPSGSGTAVLPLTGRDGLLGGLLLHNRRSGIFRTATLAVLDPIAANLSLALNAQRAMPETVAIQSRLAEAVIENSREGILICDADGVILSVNPVFEAVTGYAANEVVGHRGAILSSGLHNADFFAEMWDAIIERGYWQGEIWNRRKNGEIYPEWLSISRIPGDGLGGACYVGQFSDLSEHKETLKRLDLLGRIDPLTGLRNRRTFLQTLETFLAGEADVVVLCINLDSFRQVNQSLGMEAGDTVLRAVADRLRAGTGDTGVPGRLEGDVFAIAFPGIGVEEGRQQANVLHEAFRRPILVAETPIALGLSIGLAAAPQHGHDAETLLVAAVAAVHEAHENGRNTLAIHVPGRNAASRERLTIESQLRLALQTGELFVVFQPQMTLAEGRLVGVEALVRWRHPSHGVVTPEMFIRIAEDSGLIVPLGEFVLRESCHAHVRLQSAGLPPVPIAVNVSALHFRRDGFLPTVLAALHESGLPPHLLELELTESVLMRGSESILALMRLIRRHGVRISIDDFGTGFSSLAYLSRMNFDRLKIDHSFIDEMRRSPRAEGIVKAIIALASHLGVEVTADGVERSEDAMHLLALGCRDGQGIHFGPPMDERALLAWTQRLTEQAQ